MDVIRNRTLALRAAACLGAVVMLATSGCVLVGAPHSSGKGGGGGDVTLCHKGKKTMTLPRDAAGAHMDHGDRMGPC